MRTSPRRVSGKGSDVHASERQSLTKSTLQSQPDWVPELIALLIELEGRRRALRLGQSRRWSLDELLGLSRPRPVR
jgi:hypothetical protein